MSEQAANHNFIDFTETFSKFLFILINSPRPKDITFTMTENREMENLPSEPQPLEIISWVETDFICL